MSMSMLMSTSLFTSTPVPSDSSAEHSVYYLVTFEKHDETTGEVWDKKMCLTVEQYNRLNDYIEFRPAYDFAKGGSLKKIESISHEDFVA